MMSMRPTCTAAALRSVFELVACRDAGKVGHQAWGSGHARALASAAGVPVVPPHGIVELRDYTIKPQHFNDFLRLSAEHHAARMSAYPGFLG
jgi:hypothetical protein